MTNVKQAAVDQDMEAIESPYSQPDPTGELFHLLYTELHRQAARLMSGQAAGHTLQATALLHEAYLRILEQEKVQDRSHFIALAAKTMRSVLIDHARRKDSLKRGSNSEAVPFDSVVLSYENRAIDLLELEEALQELRDIDAKMVAAVELRFFAGLSIEETAEAIGMPTRTFRRKWNATRAFLYRHLK